MQIKVSKSTALERLSALRDAIEGLRGLDVGSPEFMKWYEDAKGAFKYVFDGRPEEFRDFGRIQFSSPGSRRRLPKVRKAYSEGLDRSSALIASKIDQIVAFWPDDEGSSQHDTVEEGGGADYTNQIFVVHGRDRGALAEVKQVLIQLGLEPVVLQDQPNQGRTIIEKFEDYAQVGFAVVICTPDDEGKHVAEDAAPIPRVRQNVLLEWGYFLGKLGRESVCALIKGEVEIPSDYAGVLYVEMDGNGDWKSRLARELNQAQYAVDANNLL